MITLNCLIIDDEPLAHDVILSHLEDIPFVKVVGQCHRATDAFTFLSKQEVDLLFLDIRMPKLNGLDFVKTLTQKPLIIITSAYEEYALESFDLEVCDYLLKPFRFDRLLKAVNRARTLQELKQQQNQNKPSIANPVDDAYIAIKVDKKHLLIKLNEIYYFESLGNYIKVWKDREFVLTQRTLSSLEEQLPKNLFIRTHKSFILQKAAVTYLEGNEIILKNGTRIPVGKNYRTTIKQLLALD